MENARCDDVLAAVTPNNASFVHVVASDLADRYDIAVQNVVDFPDDPEEVWSITRVTDYSCRKYSRQKSRASPMAHDRDHGHH